MPPPLHCVILLLALIPVVLWVVAKELCLELREAL